MNGLLICPGMTFLAQKNDWTEAIYDQTEALGKTGSAAKGLSLNSGRHHTDNVANFVGWCLDRKYRYQAV